MLIQSALSFKEHMSWNSTKHVLLLGGFDWKKTPARVITCDPLDGAQLSRPKSIFSQLLIYWLMYINVLKSNKNTMPYLEDLEV